MIWSLIMNAAFNMAVILKGETIIGGQCGVGHKSIFGNFSVPRVGNEEYGKFATIEAIDSLVDQQWIDGEDRYPWYRSMCPERAVGTHLEILMTMTGVNLRCQCDLK
jgi:hypothetical protein